MESTLTSQPVLAPKSNKQLIILIAVVATLLAALIIAAVALAWRSKTASPSTTNNISTTTETPNEQTTTPAPVTQPSTGPDLTQLPLGDQKYTSSPKVGYIYLCNTTLSGGGAYQAGPWINQTAKTWDLTQKVSVDGQVSWNNTQATFSASGATRTISGNGLPNHITGVYPISSTDDAYTYDRNPNSIKSQTVSLQLPVNPTLNTNPSCMGGEVGIMLSGVPIFNGFDAGGRDAAAWEIQDECGGHPQVSGIYHYHSESKCLEQADDNTTPNLHSELLGYALDGFGIFGQKGENGNILSTQDLDECHGHTHEITWDGQVKEMYHYHLTTDFPYSVSCFRGHPVQMQVIPGTSEQGGMTGLRPR